jgi:hypothetical protein
MPRFSNVRLAILVGMGLSQAAYGFARFGALDALRCSQALPQTGRKKNTPSRFHAIATRIGLMDSVSPVCALSRSFDPASTDVAYYPTPAAWYPSKASAQLP